MIAKFWETSAKNTISQVKNRVQSGRGGYGLVDFELPKLIEALDN